MKYMKVEKIVPTGKVTQDLTLPLTAATPVGGYVCVCVCVYVT